MCKFWPERLACLLILLAVPAMATQPNNGAVLTSSGVVVLNGAGAPPPSTAIFPGDSVRTVSGSVVTISSPGSTVLMPQNSQLTFNGNAVALNDGRAVVTTSKGLSVRTEQYVIAPAANGTAQYDIEKSAGALLVHASQGGLTITAGGKSYNLAEGSTGKLNPVTGVLLNTEAPQAVGKSSSMSTSTSLSDLKQSLTDTSDSEIPWCPSISMCKVGPSVSGHQPCRCRQYF